MREHGAFPMAAVTRPQILWPSERDKAPARCENCGARLLLGDEPTATSREEVTCLLCGRVAADLISDLTPRRLTPEQFRALPTNQGHRGRPPSATGTIVTRIARLLSHGQPMTAEVLADHLNTSVTQTRNAVGDARKQGYAITCSDGAYRLEVGQ